MSLASVLVVRIPGIIRNVLSPISNKTLFCTIEIVSVVQSIDLIITVDLYPIPLP